MEHVMHDFLARTENQKKKRKQCKTHTQESCHIKNEWEIAIRNFHHSEQE